MIIYDEDYTRLYKQMRDERERVEYYLRKGQKKALRTLSETPAPCYYYEKVKFSDTNNTYLLYYYCRNEYNRKHGTCIYGNILMTNTRDGKRIAVRLMTISEKTGRVKGKRDTLQIFTGHFFSRYRERFFSDDSKSTDEMITIFAGRNLGYMYELPYKDMVLEKNQTEKGCVWAMDDGFSFGENEWMDMGVYGKVLVVNHKTYLSEDDLKDDQWENVLPVEIMRQFAVNHYKEFNIV